MTTSEKVAYLKGLLEGMELDASSKEGKLFSKIVEILEEIASDCEDLQAQADDLQDYCDELDSDLGDVEEYLLDEAEADEDDDDDDDDEDDDFDFGESFIEATCPACGEKIYFDDSIDPEDVICPSCGEHFTYLCDGECEGCESPCPEKKDSPEKE